MELIEPTYYWWYIVAFVLFWILKWAIIIAVIIFGLKKALQRWGRVHGMKTPLEIIKERYARGEMPHEEFERMKKDLH